MLANLVRNLKLNSDSKDIASLLELPEVADVLLRADERAQASRTLLCDRQSTAPARHKKAIAEAALQAEKACEHFNKIEAEFYAARIARDQAVLAGNCADQPLRTELSQIKAALIEGRDRRLDDLFIQLDKLEDVVHNLLSVTPITERTHFGLVTNILSNSTKVSAALEVITAGKAELERLVTAPAGRAVITAAMRDICASLEPVLFALNMAAPAINVYGEILPDGKINP